MAVAVGEVTELTQSCDGVTDRPADRLACELYLERACVCAFLHMMQG